MKYDVTVRLKGEGYATTTYRDIVATSAAEARRIALAHFQSLIIVGPAIIKPEPHNNLTQSR